jgi:L-aminopeptidase/D-esterase-like protein
MKAIHNNSLTSLQGILVGHYTDQRRPTGCTVVLCPKGAVAGVDVRGAAPGTRDTDVLSPSNTLQEVHGVLLTGGSAYGLDAAGGVMRWLEERGHGFQLGPAIVPIVPAAVIFDLWVDDFSDALTKSAKNPRIRPDVEVGYLSLIHI